MWWEESRTLDCQSGHLDMTQKWEVLSPNHLESLLSLPAVQNQSRRLLSLQASSAASVLSATLNPETTSLLQDVKSRGHLAAVRAFLYNESKWGWVLSASSLHFLPFHLFFVSECAFLLQKKKPTRKKFLSSLGPCSDASWTTGGLQTTGWVMVHESILRVKSSVLTPSAKVSLFALACSPVLCQTQFCVIWVMKLPPRLWGKLFHCLPGLLGQNVPSWSLKRVFSRRTLWN